MMVKIFTSERVDVGSPAYHEAKGKAGRIAQQQHQAGKGGVVRWDDEYNDHSARGVFVVMART